MWNYYFSLVENLPNIWINNIISETNKLWTGTIVHFNDLLIKEI